MTQEAFNRKFKELFSGMLQLAFEYVDQNVEVEEVYVYISMESTSDFYNCFYRINGAISGIHEVNKYLNTPIDNSMGCMMSVIKAGTADTTVMRNLFDEFQGKVPTEIKMVYNPQTGAFNNDISYDLLYSHTKDTNTSDVFMSWLTEMKMH